MSPTIALCIFSGALATLFMRRPIHAVPMGTWSETVYWTVRFWIYGSPATDYSYWDYDEPPPSGQPPADRARWLLYWRYVSPLLESKGYYLYTRVNPRLGYIGDLSRSRPAAPVSQRYVKDIGRDDEDAWFDFKSPLIWPAQDIAGRDVVIRLVTSTRPSQELEVFALLGSQALKADPRNHSVPIIEYIKLGSDVFVVMPRWEVAVWLQCTTVGDFVRFGRGALETVAFLHDHRITHGDISASNLLTDVVFPLPTARSPHAVAGLCGPERRYAIIDFETAQVGLEGPEGERARKDDVSDMAHVLQPYLRCLCAEGFVPELNVLLDSMLDAESPNQPNSTAALAKFDEICGSLTEEDMEKPTTVVRVQGKTIRYRQHPVMYSLPPREKPSIL